MCVCVSKNSKQIVEVTHDVDDDQHDEDEGEGTNVGGCCIMRVVVIQRVCQLRQSVQLRAPKKQQQQKRYDSLETKKKKK